MFRNDVFWLLPAILVYVFQVERLWIKLPDFKESETLIKGEYREREVFRLKYLMYLTYFILLIQLVYPLFTITNSVVIIYLLRILGYILVSLGFVISLLALQELGANWTSMYYYRIKKHQKLITTGIYGVIRHPIYLSALLELVGFELIANSWILFLFLIFGTKVFLNQAIKEERLLEKAFGNSFIAYKKKTKMFLPFLF